MTPRVVFLGGKGGVGKTTLAGAIAVGAADRGARTLLVSTDPAHSTGDLFETPLSDVPTEVMARLWAVEIDPVAAADRYVADVKARIAEVTPPRLVAEVERQIDIARVTPGAEEAALFDRFARIMEEDGAGYDRIVFDTAPLGHTLRLLALPEQLDAWMSGLITRRSQVAVLGRMWQRVAGTVRAGEERPDPILASLEARRARFARARATLTDPAETRFVFVLIAERLPVLETERAIRTLEKYRIPVGGLIVNRLLPGSAEGAFLARRREREQAYLRDIARRFARYPVHHVALREADVIGIPALRELGTLLAAGL
jgi:arsenite-transporting ATPase